MGRLPTPSAEGERQGDGATRAAVPGRVGIYFFFVKA